MPAGARPLFLLYRTGGPGGLFPLRTLADGGGREELTVLASCSPAAGGTRREAGGSGPAGRGLGRFLPRAEVCARRLDRA